MLFINATALLLLGGMGQIENDVCLDLPSARRLEGQEVKISIEIVALNGAIEARQIGCERSPTILVYGQSESGDGEFERGDRDADRAAADLFGYKVEHPRDRAMASVKGKVGVLPHPPYSRLPDVITLFVSSVSHTWFEPGKK